MTANVPPSPEQNRYDERMWKTYLRTVYRPVPRTFEDREIIMIPRVVDQLVHTLEVEHYSLAKSVVLLGG